MILVEIVRSYYRLMFTILSVSLEDLLLVLCRAVLGDFADYVYGCSRAELELRIGFAFVL